MDELSRLARPEELLFVAQGTPAQADEFFQPRWPEARVVSDTERELYARFDLERVRLRELFSGAVVRAFWKHRRHGVGRPMGDTLLLSGAFALRGTTLLFSHRSLQPGDHPSWTELLDAVRGGSGDGAAL